MGRLPCCDALSLALLDDLAMRSELAHRPPRRWVCRGAVGTCIAVLAFALAACGGEDGAEEASYSVPSLTLRDLHRCKEGPGPRSLRCGAISVPFERQDESVGNTRVGFTVLPRVQRRRPSLGAIVAVEGGPGYASSWTVRSYVRLFGSLLQRRELVMVDMRGTGRSRPLDCRDLQSGRAPDWIGLPVCAERLGARFSSYRTSAAADDIDDVRRALGLGRITLYGDSYGTFLAQSYAFRHPETLDALVLDSAYPTRGESAWYPSLIETGVRGISISCRRSPECSGNAKERLRRLVHFLRSRHKGVGPLIDTLSTAAYNVPNSYLRIDNAGRKLVRGDSHPWKVLIADAKLGYGHLHHFSVTAEDIFSCNDYPLLWEKDASEAERRRQLEEEVSSYRNDALKPFSPREVALSSDTLYQYCLTVPRPSELYEPPISPGDRPTRAPVLVVSGELDNVTTPAEGRMVAEEFPDARHYVARGAGHVADLYDGGIPPAVETRRFLRNVLGGEG
jgi:pimeloyl-ACP methyl ester carboxylesterase